MSHDEYTIQLLRVAEEDLDNIVSYISIDNPRAAEKLLDRVQNSMSYLSTHPYLGKIPVDEDIAQMGYRFLIVDNYLIFYTIEERTVFVHRIITVREIIEASYKKSKQIRYAHGKIKSSRLEEAVRYIGANDVEYSVDADSGFSVNTIERG